MKCNKGIKDCECIDYHPWLLYNEKVSDFIRWQEVVYYIFLFTFAIGAGGVKGFIVAFVFDWLMHLEGGPVSNAFNVYPRPGEPIVKHTKSKICLEGKHTFCLTI